MEPNTLAAEDLPVRAKGMGQHLPQQFPRAGKLPRQLVEQFEAQQHLRRCLQGHDCLRERLTDHGAGRGGVAEEVEVGHWRGVAGGLGRTARDHDVADEFDDRRIPLENTSDVGQRAKGDDRDLAGMRLEALPDDLLRLVSAVQRHAREFDATETVSAVDAVGLLGRCHVGRRNPESRPPRGIEEGNHRLDVGRGLLRRHAAPHRGHGHHLEPRVEQGHCERCGVIDARITVDDHFAGRGSGHCRLAPGWSWGTLTTRPGKNPAMPIVSKTASSGTTRPFQARSP